MAALDWSDELYRFCLYRLKNSGFDAHKNLGRDMNEYFGAYVKYKHLLFSENQDAGNSSAKASFFSTNGRIRYRHYRMDFPYG